MLIYNKNKLIYIIILEIYLITYTTIYQSTPIDKRQIHQDPQQKVREQQLSLQIQKNQLIKYDFLTSSIHIPEQNLMSNLFQWELVTHSIFNNYINYQWRILWLNKQSIKEKFIRHKTILSDFILFSSVIFPLLLYLTIFLMVMVDIRAPPYL